MSNRNIYLASKPRYEILDGLRGVAAMLVVAYHLFETYYHGAPDQPINHGYLAVDFFFVLSGFVIGYAYDDRWDRKPIRRSQLSATFTCHLPSAAGKALTCLLAASQPTAIPLPVVRAPLATVITKAVSSVPKGFR